MPDVAEIRANLAAAAALADGALKPYGFLPDGVEPPAVVAGMVGLERSTMQALGSGTGLWRLSCDVLLVASTVWDRSAQLWVDTTVPKIWVELERDQTLSGESVAVHVSEWEPRERIDVAEWSMVGGIFRCEVMAE